MGGGGPGGGLGLERSTSSSFFAASNARLLRASSCNCLTSPSLKAKRSRMGTPACLTINSRDTRVVALSLGDVLGSLSSSRRIGLDLFSFWYVAFVTEPYGRDSRAGDPVWGAAPQCKHALIFRTLYLYHHCRDCPSHRRRPLFLSRPAAPPPRPTVVHAHLALFLTVAAASWS